MTTTESFCLICGKPCKILKGKPLKTCGSKECLHLIRQKNAKRNLKRTKFNKWF